MIDEQMQHKILDAIGSVVVIKATELAPVWHGGLRRAINHKVSKDKVTIYVDMNMAPYAEEMEYGRKPGIKITDPQEQESLKEWSEDHGIPYFAVKKKIEKKGILPFGSQDQILVTNTYQTPGGTFRPFLRPALHQAVNQKLIARAIVEVMKSQS